MCLFRGSLNARSKDTLSRLWETYVNLQAYLTWGLLSRKPNRKAIATTTTTMTHRRAVIDTQRLSFIPTGSATARPGYLDFRIIPCWCCRTILALHDSLLAEDGSIRRARAPPVCFLTLNEPAQRAGRVGVDRLRVFRSQYLSDRQVYDLDRASMSRSLRRNVGVGLR